MNHLWHLLIWQYGLPLFAVLLVIYLVERRNKVFPNRDVEELMGRVVAVFLGILLFGVIQVIIRTI